MNARSGSPTARTPIDVGDPFGLGVSVHEAKTPSDSEDRDIVLRQFPNHSKDSDMGLAPGLQGSAKTSRPFGLTTVDHGTPNQIYGQSPVETRLYEFHAV